MEKPPEQTSTEYRPLYQRIDAWLGYRWVRSCSSLLPWSFRCFVSVERRVGRPCGQRTARSTPIKPSLLGASIRSFGGTTAILQVPPRLLAIPTPFFSLRYLALYAALAATAVGALLAWSVYHL